MCFFLVHYHCKLFVKLYRLHLTEKFTCFHGVGERNYNKRGHYNSAFSLCTHGGIVIRVAFCGIELIGVRPIKMSLDTPLEANSFAFDILPLQ